MPSFMQNALARFAQKFEELANATLPNDDESSERKRSSPSTP